MSLQQELIDGVNDFFIGDYEITDGRKVPDISDIQFGKFGTEVELAMIFIDIRESTKILDRFRRQTGAKMYKSYLFGVIKIIRSNGGEVRSFNGDGVLAAFYGEYKCSEAAKAALQLNGFVSKILAPKLKKYFEDNGKFEDTFSLEHGIGIDVGNVLVVRGGIRGENNNNLVWVGNATNYAVKLSSQSKIDKVPVHISKEVFNKLNNTSKVSDQNSGGKIMWEKTTWDRTDDYIYRSAWTWSIK